MKSRTRPFNHRAWESPPRSWDREAAYWAHVEGVAHRLLEGGEARNLDHAIALAQDEISEHEREAEEARGEERFERLQAEGGQSI